jgi:glycosyltransferase involved in cell wall biosynthesis
MIGVSIIICCYNSSSRIRTTLEYLLRQKVPSNILWEVIVVNNASTDNTAQIAEEVWKQSEVSVQLYIVDQPTPGLSFAREKGIEEARYEYLLFCDDDNWLDENYVSNVFRVMRDNEVIGALGGLGIPYFETDPPSKILKYSGIYATGPQREGTGEVCYPHVYGAGCTYRKSAITYLFNNGFKYQLTGRSGDKMVCGEDHELCYALFLSGYEIWASDKLTFHHFIPASRITTDYIKRNIMGIAQSNFILSIYKLIIANTKKQRPSYKNKWEWVLTSKGVSVISNSLKKLKGSGMDELLKIELEAEVYSFLLFLKKRTTFYSMHASLSSSSWISRTS